MKRFFRYFVNKTIFLYFVNETIFLLQVPPAEVADVEDDQGGAGENKVPETEESESSAKTNQFDTQFKFLHNPWFSTRDQEIGQSLLKV